MIRLISFLAIFRKFIPVKTWIIKMFIVFMQKILDFLFLFIPIFVSFLNVTYLVAGHLALILVIREVRNVGVSDLILDIGQTAVSSHNLPNLFTAVRHAKNFLLLDIFESNISLSLKSRHQKKLLLLWRKKVLVQLSEYL